MDKEVSSLSRMQIARMVSFVPQSSHTAFSFSCLEMILMGGVSRMKMWAAPNQQDRQKALQICAKIGIAELALASFNHLSGGQRQLVMVARALYQDAPIMLLDEPNSHLDFCNQHKIMSLVQQIVQQSGVTALITLHDPNLALHYCTEVIMLKQGRIMASGSTKLTLNDANLQATFGDNIKIDTTSSGVQVVVPRYINC
jgi:iron complex transport system ATP-binding protein